MHLIYLVNIKRAYSIEYWYAVFNLTVYCETGHKGEKNWFLLTRLLVWGSVF